MNDCMNGWAFQVSPSFIQNENNFRIENDQSKELKRILELVTSKSSLEDCVSFMHLAFIIDQPFVR